MGKLVGDAGFYGIIFEELTHNNLFKFNFSKFQQEAKSTLGWMFYRKSTNTKDNDTQFTKCKTVRKYVHEVYPEIKLDHREKNGVDFHFLLSFLS